MENSKAIEVLKKRVACERAELDDWEGCAHIECEVECNNYVSKEEVIEAMITAIAALEHKEEKT